MNRIVAGLISLCLPGLGFAQQPASMAQFTIARSQVSEFASELGPYEACYELVEDIRQSRTVSDHAGTLKVLYQGAIAPEKLRLSFMEKLERAGYNFDQMYMLDELLTSDYPASKTFTKSLIKLGGNDDILVICSQARALPTRY